MKRVGIIILCVLVLIVSLVIYKVSQNKKIAAINSYNDCVAAGYPVLDSYPGQCRVNDKSFTQDIGNELEYSQEFLLNNPRPNQVISSPISVNGKAKGSWFFEGSFSGELFDEKNVSLGKVILSAQGDWMTEDFVEFEGNLKFTKPNTKMGTLIIKNDNPSGLPENEKIITVPVLF